MLRNADIRNALRKPNALLLAGGVFGLALVAACFLRTHRFVRDPIPAVRNEAAAALAFFGPWPEGLLAALPQALASSMPDEREGLVLIVRPDGKAEWRSVGRKKADLRLLPKSVDAVGFMAADGRQVPLSAAVESDRLVFRAGRGFRGLRLDGAQATRRAGFKVIPSSTALYYRDPDPSSSSGLPSDTGLGPVLSAFRGFTEVVLMGEEPPARTFILHSAPGTGAPINQSVLDKAAGALAGTLVSASHAVRLPDKTLSTELRSARETLVMKTHEAGGVVTKRFETPAGEHALTYVIDPVGRAWIGNDTSRLKEAVLKNSSLPTAYEYSCSGIHNSIELLIYPQNMWKSYTYPLLGLINLNKFKAVALSVNKQEPGLYTFCGYF